MKYIIVLTMLFTFNGLANNQWEIYGETVECEFDLKIMAREGEKSIYVIQEKKSYELFPKFDVTFSKKPQTARVYDSYNIDYNGTISRYLFTQPEEARDKDGVIKINSRGRRTTCKVLLSS